MLSNRRRPRVLALAATAIVLSSCNSHASSVALAAPDHQPALDAEGSGAQVIDSSVDETFTPTAGDVAMRTKVLNPNRAYRKADGGGPVPKDFEHYLGYLTLPLGAGAPGEFTAHHQLVYAFTAPVCGPRIDPVPLLGKAPSPSPSPSASPSPSNCTQWEFVDAQSGKMIDQTWTQ